MDPADHIAQVVTSIPFILLVTQWLKQYVPNSLRLFLPLALGPALTYFAHAVGHVEMDAAIVENVLKAASIPGEGPVGALQEGLNNGMWTALGTKILIDMGMTAEAAKAKAAQLIEAVKGLIKNGGGK